jgi:transcriptional regulator
MALSVLRGTLDILVLKALSWRPMHGFEITEWLEQSAGGNLELVDSALYQALYRLEERRLISAVWGVTENNRRARYYEVTAAGRAFLKAETAKWLTYADTVSGILTAPPDESPCLGHCIDSVELSASRSAGGASSRRPTTRSSSTSRGASRPSSR